MPHAPIVRTPAFLMLFLTLFIAPSFSGCHEAPEEGASSVVARVNGEAILQEELDRQMLRIDNNFALPAEQKQDRKFSEMILRRIIRRHLLLQEARKKGMTLSSGDAAKVVAERQGGISRKGLEEMLGNSNLTYEEWKRKVVEDAAIDRLIQQRIDANLRIDDEELVSYYEGHSDEFNLPERVRVRQIVVAKKEEAIRVRKRLTDGKEDFGLVAVEVSLSPDAAQGGDIGTFARGQMPPEFDKICFALEIGEISPVVKSPYGYHLFRVEEHLPAGRQSFKDARKGLYKKFLSQKREAAFQLYQEELWGKAIITLSEGK